MRFETDNTIAENIAAKGAARDKILARRGVRLRHLSFIAASDEEQKAQLRPLVSKLIDGFSNEAVRGLLLLGNSKRPLQSP